MNKQLFELVRDFVFVVARGTIFYFILSRMMPVVSWWDIWSYAESVASYIRPMPSKPLYRQALCTFLMELMIACT